MVVIVMTLLRLLLLLLPSRPLQGKRGQYIQGTKQLSQSHMTRFHPLHALFIVDANDGCGDAKGLSKDLQQDATIPGSQGARRLQ